MASVIVRPHDEEIIRMKSKYVFHALVILTCFLVWLPGKTAAADSIKWYKYEEGMAQGEIRKKPVFLHFYANWCFFCRMMAQKTFKDPLVVSYLNKNFIAIMVDVDKEGKTTSMYGVRALPDTWFLTQRGKRIRNILGYLEPDDLLSILKEVQRIDLQS